jgi:uncharacterized membrane protein YhaH (DUF805 family)
MDLAEWFSFRGRIARRTWWLGYFLPILGLSILAFLVDAMLGLVVWPEGGGPVQLIVGLATLVGGLAGGAKRWHDRDCSGWWQLVLLIPAIGWLWNLVAVGFLRGNPGPNRFGPDPLGTDTTVWAPRPPRRPGGSVPPT